MTDQYQPGQPWQNGPQNQPPPWWNELQQPAGQPRQPFETGQIPSAPQPAPVRRLRKQRGRGPKIIGAIAYSVVILLIGVAIGSSAASKAGTPSANPSPAPAVSLPATIRTNNSGSSSTTGPASDATPTPANHVLIRFAGNGIENSAPFNIGSGPLTVHYSFNCANFGQAGNFQADLLYGNQSSLNSDDQSIANALAPSGAETTTVYPQDPGQDYYLSVNSECNWRIRVVGQ